MASSCFVKPSEFMRVKMVHKFRTVCKFEGLLLSLLLMFIFLSGAPTAVERERRGWSKGCPARWAQDMLLLWGGEKQPPSLLVCVWWVHDLLTEQLGAP